MRLFVGIPLASEVQNELSEAVERLRSPHDGLRWTTPDTWHITLQFLGNTDGQHCECATTRLAEIRAEPVDVRLGSFGCFERAGVFLVDVVPTAELTALARSVTAATALCGFSAETRPYRPHITLARAKGQGGEKVLKALDEKLHRSVRSRFTATEFLLYESFTRPEGAKYEVRGRFGLAGKG